MRASEITPKKLVVFDIDDTLVHTQTKVHVVKDGRIVNSLNSHDFTHYKLKPGESFDFEDFRNAREFFEKSKPIIPMMRQLRQDIATGNKVVMVTARADFDDKELFLDTFRKYGIDIDKVHVYRAGNSKQGTTEERKKAIIKKLLDAGDYTKAIMYDDAKPNLHTFIELKKDHPRTRFYAWHVSLDGEASEYMRENFVTEKKKRKKRKSRWAAYGPGPYGSYGFAAGYSGDGGAAGGGGGVGEASYPGNVGMMELAKFFQIANDKEKEILKQLLEKGKRGLAWKLIQDVTGTKLQGQEFQEEDLEEGWRDWVGGAALGAAVATGGPAAYDAFKDKPAEEPAKVMAVKKQEKSPEIKPNAVPKQSVTGSPHEKFLTKAAVAAGIKGEELAQFLAQTSHESHNFKSMVEYGGSLDFKKYEPRFAKDKKGKLVQVNPKAKTLGNIKKGDGARYKGRGYIQLTGRYNYKRAGEALGLPLEQKPELVEKPEIAAKVAIWFWQNRVQPKVDNFGDTRASTRPINPGLKGLEDRKEKFQDFRLAMR
jgi:predicted chitinase/FMN phosphatase YigB (HAD superfamily)